MELDDGQIYIYNQDYKIPNTKGLFVIVSFLGSQPHSIRDNIIEDVNGSLLEEINMNSITQFQIDIQSKDSSARLRNEEIIVALNSNISQQAQELHKFKIARMPSAFNDTSITEQPAMYNKFSITINVYTWKKNLKTVDYYNDISFNSTTEN